MVLGGILSATLVAGCFGGGGNGYPGYGYSSSPYSGYSSNYSSYGNSYPYSGYNSGYGNGYGYGYSYPRNYGYNNSYNAGYQNGVRVDANRDRGEDRNADRHVTVSRDFGRARTETHSTAARENVSRKESGTTERSEKN